MHVITHNPRVSVSHDEMRAKFRLHIAGATLEDAGPYMCQINSMPVVKQVSQLVFDHRTESQKAHLNLVSFIV